MYALSWKLLNIGLLSEYFATLLKRLHLKKKLENVPYFFSNCTLFLMWRSRTSFWIRIKFHLGRTKGRGKRGYGRRSPKWGLFFAKFPFVSKIKTSTHKLLGRQTSNYHYCNWHAQKPIGRDFQVILSSSSWSKTTLCIFKEQIWLPNRKCYGKINSILTRKK